MKAFTIENESNNITIHASAREAEAVLDSERFASTLFPPLTEWLLTQRYIRIQTRGLRTRLIYETTVSTIENSAETAARLSRPQLEQERAGHPA